MVYTVDTNASSPTFGMRIATLKGYENTYPDIADYEGLAEPVEDDAPAGVRRFQMHVHPADRAIPTAQDLQTRNRKKFNLDRILDVWTSSPFPLVSQKAKDFLETQDPGIHLFLPVRLHLNGSAEPMSHTNFYRFVCRRLLEIEEGAATFDGSRDDDIVGRFTWKYRMGFLHERPEVAAYVAQFPIWASSASNADRRLFMNEAVIEAAKKTKIKGLEVSSGGVLRHANRVF